MKSKSISIPVGMVFGKHYCAKCGAKLEKEKTHRVVTKDDPDYYKYQDLGSFPRWDHDVYEYRFKCPECEARTSYEEQRILKRIQKKCGHKALSSDEIKDNYKECKKSVKRNKLLIGCIISPLIYLAIATLAYLFATEKTSTELLYCSLVFLGLSAFTIFVKVRKYKGNYDSKFMGMYSYEQESLYKKLHTYSTHNRKMVENSEKCHCYFCKNSVDSSDVTSYTDGGETAICPRCGVSALIPDNVDEQIDNKTIYEMNQYWF